MRDAEFQQQLDKDTYLKENGNGAGKASGVQNGLELTPVSKEAIPADSLQHQVDIQTLINSYLEGDDDQSRLIATCCNREAKYLTGSSLQGIVNLKPVNSVRFLNKFFESINHSLQQNGTFIMCVETLPQRRRRQYRKYRVLYPLVRFVDFTLHQAISKLRLTRRLYFALTKGRNRIITLTETLGRLISCGFEIQNHQYINGKVYIAARKISKPLYDMKPTYGLICTLNRIGKDGRQIKLYKMRTMHPFAEYLQDYVYKLNELDEGGKFKNDFRITAWGHWMRKLWIDEQPMWFNFLKGDLKLVGVRPLTRQYFELYPEDMQKKRTQVKPGLIPPFYVDMPSTFDEVVESERRYLDAYNHAPLRTDMKYLVTALYNIFIKRARSG